MNGDYESYLLRVIADMVDDAETFEAKSNQLYIGRRFARIASRGQAALDGHVKMTGAKQVKETYAIAGVDFARFATWLEADAYRREHGKSTATIYTIGK